ncbi:hypothetical protein Gorai_021436, partial [Gossypium raimondii]|nr:hypothetical protein [Gossypium raimondii]
NLSCLAIWVCLNSASPKVLSYNTNAAHPSFPECSMAMVFPHNCLTGLCVYCPNGRHQIASICPDFKNECPRCDARAETLIHALKERLTTRTILAFIGLDNRGKEDDARVIWDKAKTLCHGVQIHNLVNKPFLPVTPANKS